MWRNPCIRHLAPLIDGSELESLGDDVWTARLGGPTVPNAVFQQEERRDVSAVIGIVNEHCTLLHQVVVLLPHQADQGLKQGVAWVDKGGNRLLVDCALLKADALVFLLKGCPGANLVISLAHH